MGNVMAILSIPLLQPAMYSLHSSLAPPGHSRVFLDTGASFTIIITLCQSVMMSPSLHNAWQIWKQRHLTFVNKYEVRSLTATEVVGATTFNDNNNFPKYSLNHGLEIVKSSSLFLLIFSCTAALHWIWTAKSMNGAPLVNYETNHIHRSTGGVAGPHPLRI